MGRVARQLELKGMMAAAVTPRLPKSLEPDFSAALDQLDFLAQNGMSAVVLLGSTGEFLDYGFPERQRLVYLGSKRTRVPLLAGVSHSTLEGAVQLAEEAVSAGADGLLLMPPYFFRYRQIEIEAFYREFARQTGEDVPILLYNIPQFTSGLEIDTVARLLDSGRFAGIKDSCGDWTYHSQLIELKRSRSFALFCGWDRIAGRALREGADGVISGGASALPELFAALGRSPGSAILEQMIGEFWDRMECFPFPAGIRLALELRGQRTGPLLIPLAPEINSRLAEFSQWFLAWLPEMKKAVASA